MDLPACHAAALDVTAATVAGIGADQWALPTPCDGWDVRYLLNHIVTGNLWVPELVGGRTIEDVGDTLDGDRLGNDSVGAYSASAASAAAAFAAAGAMDAPCAVSYGPVPGSVYCGHRLIDVLVHGWDLAAATRQDTSLPEELCAACLEVLEPQKEELLASGAFGTFVAAPAASGAQTVLLGTLGRSPSWAPPR
ncbi:MAG: TIGR03086 family protein [Acidimicrobiia bacterium]|nr:TIGR03086 family protein [Acidimicrobiia bacterium]